MKTAKKSSGTNSNGRRKSAPAVQTHTAEHVKRQERTIHFLTQDELRQLFKVIRSKRDKAIFLVAYRHGLRASEIGLLQRADVDAKQGRISIHRLKGSISAVYPMQPEVLKAIRSYLRTRTDEVKPRRAPAFGPARHWRFAGGAFTPPLTKGMLTPPWNPSIRFPALTGGA